MRSPGILVTDIDLRNEFSRDKLGSYISTGAASISFKIRCNLRRTGATMMQQLGVGLDIIDRCQNHVLPGNKVRWHYMHHDYADEKRTAWAALGARLSAALQPDGGT